MPKAKQTLVEKIGQFATLSLKWIDNSEDLSDAAFRLYVILRRLTHSEMEIAWPSYAEIRRRTGMRREKISKAIKELEKAELLTIKRTKGMGSEYSLNACGHSEKQTNSKKRTSSEIGTGTSSENGTGASSENGTGASSEKRTGTSSEIGTEYRSTEIEQRNRASSSKQSTPDSHAADQDSAAAAAKKTAASIEKPPASRFDFSQIEEFCRTKQHSTNPGGLAFKLWQTGEEDHLIERWLNGKNKRLTNGERQDPDWNWDSHADALIATNDVAQLENERSGIVARGGAKASWERRIMEALNAAQ